GVQLSTPRRPGAVVAPVRRVGQTPFRRRGAPERAPRVAAEGSLRGAHAGRRSGPLRTGVERLVDSGVLLNDLHVVPSLGERDPLGEELLVTVLGERGPATDAVRARVVRRQHGDQTVAVAVHQLGYVSGAEVH